MTDLGGGTLTVISQCVHNDCHAAGAIALVGDGLKVLRAAGAQRLVDGTLDIVIRHINSLCLGNHRRQTGVVGGIAGAAALLHSHNDFLGNFGKCGRALGIGSALGLLNIMPFRMSGHS